MKIKGKVHVHTNRWLTASIVGAVLSVALILVTLEIVRRNLISFVVTQQRYIISGEAALLGVLFTEMLARIVSHSFRDREGKIFGSRFRVMIRIAGYLVAIVSVISILAANPTLGISTGAIAGVVIAFATQNIIGNILAAVLILNTRMVHIGEQITVAGVKGTVADINLSHTILHVDDDVVFIPNTVMVSQAVRRKKRPGRDVWVE